MGESSATFRDTEALRARAPVRGPYTRFESEAEAVRRGQSPPRSWHPSLTGRCPPGPAFRRLPAYRRARRAGLPLPRPMGRRSAFSGRVADSLAGGAPHPRFGPGFRVQEGAPPSGQNLPWYHGHGGTVVGRARHRPGHHVCEGGRGGGGAGRPIGVRGPGQLCPGCAGRGGGSERGGRAPGEAVSRSCAASRAP